MQHEDFLSGVACKALARGMCVHVSRRKTYWSEANPIRKRKQTPTPVEIIPARPDTHLRKR